MRLSNNALLKILLLTSTLLNYSSVFASCVGLGCSCSVTGNTVGFGTYNPFSSTAINSTGDIAVTCSSLVVFSASYQISLSTGGGSYANRTMSSSGQTITYNLYLDAAHSTVWGNGTAGTGTVSDSYSLVISPHTVHYPVYGVAPGSQNVAAGSYKDTITITVTY